jgi:hypothetical protein
VRLARDTRLPRLPAIGLTTERKKDVLTASTNIAQDPAQRGPEERARLELTPRSAQVTIRADLAVGDRSASERPRPTPPWHGSTSRYPSGASKLTLITSPGQRRG